MTARTRWSKAPSAVLSGLAALWLGVNAALAAQPIKIDFWSPFPPGDLVSPTATLQVLVNEFNQTHPNIEVVHTGIPINELGGKYLTAFAAGLLPDVGWGAPTQFYSTENLLPVERLAARDKIDTTQFWPGSWGGYATIDGIQWGWPFEEGAQALLYNVSHFEAAGLPGAPATWEDFIAYARKLTDSGRGKYALQPIWSPFELLPHVWQNRGDILSPDAARITFTDAKTVEAVQWIGDWERVHRLVGGSVPAGTASMIFIHPGWYEYSRTFNFEVGYAPLPIPAGGQQATRSFYQELVIFRSQTESEAAAWTFMKWLMSPERIARWNVKTGYLPTNRAVLNTPAYRDWLQANPGMRAWLEMMNYVHGLPRVPGFNTIYDLFMQAVNQVRQGKASARAALAAVQDAAQGELDQIRAE